MCGDEGKEPHKKNVSACWSVSVVDGTVFLDGGEHSSMIHMMGQSCS